MAYLSKNAYDRKWERRLEWLLAQPFLTQEEANEVEWLLWLLDL